MFCDLPSILPDCTSKSKSELLDNIDGDLIESTKDLKDNGCVIELFQSSGRIRKYTTGTSGRIFPYMTGTKR